VLCKRFCVQLFSYVLCLYYYIIICCLFMFILLFLQISREQRQNEVQVDKSSDTKCSRIQQRVTQWTANDRPPVDSGYVTADKLLDKVNRTITLLCAKLVSFQIQYRHTQCCRRVVWVMDITLHNTVYGLSSEDVCCYEVLLSSHTRTSIKSVATLSGTRRATYFFFEILTLKRL